MLYSINEIFYSIQGEGRNTGMPAWFIRFAGCNLKCSWCDTSYEEVKSKIPACRIVEIIKQNFCKNVILTGGEPSLQDLFPLLRALKTFGCYTAIETNGTQPLLEYRTEGLLDWVTVSPKQLPIKVGCLIDEIKVVFPFAKPNNYSAPFFKQCEAIKANYYYIQPCDNEHREDNIAEAIRIVKQNPKWRLSIQTHKILKIS